MGASSACTGPLDACTDQIGVGPRKLRQRHVYLGRRFGFVEAVLQLSHDADDLSLTGWKESWHARGRESHANRVPSTEVAAHERLVDDADHLGW